MPAPTSATPSASATTAAPRVPTHIVGLGDSVMAGTNCDCAGPLEALADRLQLRDPDAERITSVNLAVDGATTRDVTDVLVSEEGRAEVQQADVIVVIVGANDLTDAYGAWVEDPEDAEPLDEALAALESSLPETLAELRRAHGERPATYLVAGYWNVFAEASADEEQAGYADWSREATTRANDLIRRSAEDAGMTYVDLVAPFRGAAGTGDPTPLLADDGDHPNAAGVEVIADALADHVS